jgi:hypothetical protein
MHDIEVQYLLDCPNLPVLLERLEAVTCGRVKVRLTEIDPADRVPAGFAGSPSLIIDGRNPYGSDDSNAGATCTLRIPSLSELKALLDPDGLRSDAGRDR